jgi:hypothetical protein
MSIVDEIMSLKELIAGDIKKAMIAKEKEKLTALRAIKSAILLAETDKGSTGELSEEQEVALLMKAAKQRKDSAEIYKQQGRDDLAEVEVTEVNVIEAYLPKQLSDQELELKLQEIITTLGAKGPGDMGKIMGKASGALKGQADGKRISTLVKKLLSK